MAALSSVALIAGLALGAAGAGTATYGAIKANDAQKDEIAAQQKSEASREQGMKLDAQRKQREMVRQGILARSQSLTQGASQGAQFSSGVEGAIAGATEQTNYNVLGVNEQSQLGSQIFQNNRDAFAAKSRQADAASVSAIGGGLSTLGGALLKNIGGIDRLGGVGQGFVNNQVFGGPIRNG